VIPFSDLSLQYLSLKEEIDASIQRVLDGGWFILGREVQAFEEEFAKYVGARYAVGVGSGTEALHLGLVACGVGPGDEVITVSHTAVATVAAVELTGAHPVLVDIDPRSYTMDPAYVEASMGPATKAIVPVHLYGQTADLDPILSVARRCWRTRLRPMAPSTRGARLAP
jgi:dTDP-4-amino-4,6-dideoxygalactose transaminase